MLIAHPPWSIYNFSKQAVEKKERERLVQGLGEQNGRRGGAHQVTPDFHPKETCTSCSIRTTVCGVAKPAAGADFLLAGCDTVVVERRNGGRNFQRSPVICPIE